MTNIESHNVIVEIKYRESIRIDPWDKWSFPKGSDKGPFSSHSSPWPFFFFFALDAVHVPRRGPTPLGFGLEQSGPAVNPPLHTPQLFQHLFLLFL